MEKLKMHSPDLSQENIAKIRDLFPGCVTEACDEVTGAVRLAVDFDQLRQELSDHIVDGPQERYRLDWPGKREALAVTNAPVAKTLRPLIEESVNFDQTRNLFIEGENLDALKLLQENYLGRIKLIYIDPPYNTGNDFIYEDDFSQGSDVYLRKSNQLDGEGNRLVANTSANGRFHSDWLSLMYPRLRMARNLLSDDGAIFINIDDSEVSNLKSICDEIFGEGNFIANVAWKHTQQSKNDEKYFARVYNSLLIYRKSDNLLKFRFPRTDADNKNYSNPDNDPRGQWRAGDVRSPNFRKTLCYDIVTPSGKKISPPENGWRWSEETVKDKIRTGEISFSRDETRIIRKIYLEDQEGRTPENLWDGEMAGTSRQANTEVKELFDGLAIFDTPKPTALVKRIASLFHEEKDYIALDFFAGSGTTAAALMQLNSEDAGCRKVIVVQIPEPCAEGSAPFKAGYKTIAEVSKERIRRAGKKILEGAYHPDWNRDVGFRVLKIDTSNMQDVYYRPDQVNQKDLLTAVDNFKPDRSAEDLLFQVLVDWGVDLTLPIKRETVQGKTVFFVDENALVACFDTGVTEELVKEFAGREPLRIVFRDNGFVSDAVKINVEQVFRQLSPSTDVKSI